MAILCSLSSCNDRDRDMHMHMHTHTQRWYEITMLLILMTYGNGALAVQISCKFNGSFRFNHCPSAASSVARWSTPWCAWPCARSALCLRHRAKPPEPATGSLVLDHRTREPVKSSSHTAVDIYSTGYPDLVLGKTSLPIG